MERLVRIQTFHSRIAASGHDPETVTAGSRRLSPVTASTVNLARDPLNLPGCPLSLAVTYAPHPPHAPPPHHKPKPTRPASSVSGGGFSPLLGPAAGSAPAAALTESWRRP